MSPMRVQMVNQPTIISAFAGCGGSSLGYQLAGFCELLAIEWDSSAAKIFELNFPGVPIYRGDIAALTGKECMRLAGLPGPGELDVLDGSPPCQGFSTAGKRKLADTRNSLFREFARILNELQPRVFVMENVTGLVTGYMKQVYLAIMAELRDCGYRCKGQVLNAMYFNVPQSRERVIVIGVRRDLGVSPSHPKPQTKPLTTRSAIGHLPAGKPGNHSSNVIKAWYKARPNQSLRKACRYVGSFQSVRLDPNRPSPTQIRAHLNWHYSTPRQLTIQEAAIIQSFPEDFVFVGTKASVKAYIGNSVPPNMMRAIATHIRDMILDPIAKPETNPA